MDVPGTPVQRSKPGPLGDVQASPDLSDTDTVDLYLDQYGRPLNKDTPASLVLNAALANISIIDVPTPVSPKAAAPRGMGRGGPRRINFDDPEQAAAARVVHVPPRRTAPPLFEVYSDTPATVKTTGRSARGTLLVRRQMANVAREAKQFVLEMSNVGGRGRATQVIKTINPIVDDSQMLHGGRCVVSFVPRMETLDPPPLGVISIKHSLLPQRPATREERTDLLKIHPVFVTPAGHHLTLIMPSTHPSTIANHFVLELFHGRGYPVIRVAVAKAVLASLLYVRENEIKFYDIPVGEDILISLVIHVQRSPVIYPMFLPIVSLQCASGSATIARTGSSSSQSSRSIGTCPMEWNRCWFMPPEEWARPKSSSRPVTIPRLCLCTEVERKLKRRDRRVLRAVVSMTIRSRVRT